MIINQGMRDHQGTFKKRSLPRAQQLTMSERNDKKARRFAYGENIHKKARTPLIQRDKNLEGYKYNQTEKCQTLQISTWKKRNICARKAYNNNANMTAIEFTQNYIKTFIEIC